MAHRTVVLWVCVLVRTSETRYFLLFLISLTLKRDTQILAQRETQIVSVKKRGNGRLGKKVPESKCLEFRRPIRKE